MKIYWTILGESSKHNPEIFEADLEKNGFFVGAPGVVIFRTREEAEIAIEKVKYIREGKGWL